MKRILFFGVMILALAACNKDKVESKPHLKFKSFNSDVIGTSGILRATLEFTDQEGDLDSIFIIRQRLNIKKPSLLGFPYSGIPAFGNQKKGELQVNIDIANNLIFNLSPIGTIGNYERDT